jgi:PST family polysaccharide transporter
MRFTTLAVIETVSLLVSTAAGIFIAIAGYGYWALVGITVTAPIVFTICVWLAAAWVPGRPRRHQEVGSMMRFGGMATLNVLVVYVAYNLEKVLLGRFWGAEALGIYGRAYQLINIPTDNLNSATGAVGFAALSRLQGDPDRLKKYFLKGYSLVLALTLPLTIVCALFADDLILVLLGPKWTDAVPIFRLLAPTILIFAVINPLGWFLFSIGRIGRSLRIALVIAPLVIAGYVVGLPYGPKGVALGYSTAMALWVVPNIAWCVHGTVISFRDILQTLSRPLFSSITAAALAYSVQVLFAKALSPLPKLILECGVIFGAYLVMLLYFGGQKAFYLELLRGLRASSRAEENSLAPA